LLGMIFLLQIGIQPLQYGYGSINLPIGKGASDQFSIPANFSLITSVFGVDLYKKDYPGGSPDYVQVVDLRKGASLELLYGRIVEPRPGKGVYGGNDPRITIAPLGQFWSQVKSAKSNAFCITNGSFFYMPESPTRLAFPLKVNGQIITDGWAIRQYPELKLMVEIWDKRVDIVELTETALYSSDAPNIIAGLEEEANKRLKYSVGRTFLGIDDQDGNGSFETVLVINTLSATQLDIVGVLREWGADKVMMLDGGGSTQLICQGKDYVKSDRLIPQAIAIIAGEQKLFAAMVTYQPVWPVIMAGEDQEFTIQFQNIGTQPWQAGQVNLVFGPTSQFPEQKLPIDQDVAPGRVISKTISLPGFPTSGIHNIELPWTIQNQGESYLGDRVLFSLVVLPQKLVDQRSAIEDLIFTWKHQDPQQVQGQVETWLKTNSAIFQETNGQELIERIDLNDAVWIWIIIIPLGFGIFWIIRRIQKEKS
jgi:hypothetical protein